jgi:N-methylhydantoinase A/acetophenone carboxylase
MRAAIRRARQWVARLLEIKFVRDTLALQTGNFVSVVVGVVASIVLVRGLGSAEYGLYSLMLTMYGLLMTLNLTGLGPSATTQLSEAVAAEDRAETARVMAFFVQMSLAVAVIATALALALAQPVAARSYGDASIGSLLQIYIFTLFFTPVHNLALTMLKSTRSMQSFTVFNNVTAVLDAYLQQSMQNDIGATWDKLRDKGFRGAFLMIHNSGGSADIFKTPASRTFNGGPVAGLMGSAYFAEKLGYRNVIAGDMGGTSFDVALVVESSVRNYTFRPVIDKWMVNVTMMQTVSIGAGGGSIASVDATGHRLEVGPRSAGSMPGPVCYDLGGVEPTVTDADVVLGYINPDTYYGGRMPLNKAKAEKAIRERIAAPLGIDTVEAAALIRQVIDENMASAIKREVHMRGYHPEDFVLFAFGGAGPTHMAGLRGDVSKAVVFPAAPVFCAMGSSIMDIVHMYEQSRRMVFMEPMSERLVIDSEQFNATVDAMIARAKQELASEGLEAEDAKYSLELDMLYGGQVNLKRASSPLLHIRSDEDARAIYDAFEKEFSDAFSPLVVNKPGGVFLDNFMLRVTVPTWKPALPEYPLQDRDASAAMIGERKAYWTETGSWLPTPIYQFEQLQPGNEITGPAVVEAEFTTVVVPPGQKFTIDRHGLGILEPVVAAPPRRRIGAQSTVVV